MRLFVSVWRAMEYLHTEDGTHVFHQLGVFVRQDVGFNVFTSIERYLFSMCNQAAMNKTQITFVFGLTGCEFSSSFKYLLGRQPTKWRLS